MLNRGASPLGLPCTRPPSREALWRDLAGALAQAGARVARSLCSLASLFVTLRRRSSVDDDGPAGHARRLARELVKLLLIDLALQHDDAVDERLGARRAAGHEHVHRHDLIDSLHQRV